MICTERLAAIAITSFGLIVGRAVRKEPLDLLNQIKDSGEIAIPFTIALAQSLAGSARQSTSPHSQPPQVYPG